VPGIFFFDCLFFYLLVGDSGITMAGPIRPAACQEGGSCQMDASCPPSKHVPANGSQFVSLLFPHQSPVTSHTSSASQEKKTRLPTVNIHCIPSSPSRSLRLASPSKTLFSLFFHLSQPVSLFFEFWSSFLDHISLSFSLLPAVVPRLSSVSRSATSPS
jgi:hypothetical protein